MLLPLGAVLCFFDLLGARAFARGELFLQTQFHSPLLLYPTPYPPRPIFTRHREPTTIELETGQPPLTRGGMVRERSFYKNTYAMVSWTNYRRLVDFRLNLNAVYRLYLIPSTILLPCHQASYHTTNFSRPTRCGPSLDHSRLASTSCLACDKEDRYLASQCSHWRPLLCCSLKKNLYFIFFGCSLSQYWMLVVESLVTDNCCHSCFFLLSKKMDFDQLLCQFWLLTTTRH